MAYLFCKVGFNMVSCFKFLHILISIDLCLNPRSCLVSANEEAENSFDSRIKRNVDDFTDNSWSPRKNQPMGKPFLTVPLSGPGMVKHGVSPIETLHTPNDPKFELLLSQMRPIIPGRFATRKIGGLRSAESPFAPFLRSIIQLSKDLKIKTAPEPGSKKDKILLQIAQKAKSMLAKNQVKQSELNNLMALFNEFFAEPKVEQARPLEEAKAPFCELGDDCFLDVDHPKLAMEIKRLALTLSSYLTSRMVETRSGQTTNPSKMFDPSMAVQYKTDAILTQIVANIAKMHRAVLRNWHHLLLLVGNFAGPHTTLLDSKVDPMDKANTKITVNSTSSGNNETKDDPDNNANNTYPVDTGTRNNTASTNGTNNSSNKIRKKRETPPHDVIVDAEESANYLSQVQNWISEMESIMTTSDTANTFYNNNNLLADLRSTPDVLCGSEVLPAKTGDSGNEDHCSYSDFWFLDINCRSVVTNPAEQCFPQELWVQFEGQYAFQVNKAGRWSFTVALNIEQTGNVTDAGRQVVVGQLLRLPKEDPQSMEVLLRIDNFLSTTRDGRQLQMSVDGKFSTGDLILLRLLPLYDHRLSVTLYGIHERDNLP